MEEEEASPKLPLQVVDVPVIINVDSWSFRVPDSPAARQRQVPTVLIVQQTLTVQVQFLMDVTRPLLCDDRCGRWSRQSRKLYHWVEMLLF